MLLGGFYSMPGGSYAVPSCCCGTQVVARVLLGGCYGVPGCCYVVAVVSQMVARVYLTGCSGN